MTTELDGFQMATRVEERAHLGPHEVEIDSPLYAVMFIANTGQTIMATRTFSSLEKALTHADTFSANAYVVRISGTNS